MTKVLLAGVGIAALMALAPTTGHLTREAPSGERMERGTPPPSRGQREMAFTGTSYDPATRIAEGVFATGVRVNRRWFSEELDMSAEALDLSRVGMNQCRFLFNHDCDEVLGVVVEARLQEGVLVGKVKFAETPMGDLYAGMAERGELTGISIGYQVSVWNIIQDIASEHDVWRATKWELLEVSLVSIPADKGAGLRSVAPSPAQDGAPVETHGDDDMKRNQPGGQTAVTVGAAAAVAAVAAAAPAAAAEGARAAPAAAVVEVSAPAAAAAPVIIAADAAAARGLSVTDVLELQSQARALNVDIAEVLQAQGATRSSVEGAILRAAAAAQAAQPAAGAPAAGEAARIGRDETETRRSAMIEAISARMAMRAPEEIGRGYMGYRLLDIAAEMYGIRSRDPNEIYEGVRQRAMMGTSDFPLLLEASANKNLLAAYRQVQPTYRALAARKSFTDFKPHSFLRVGDFPDLVDLGEGGQIKAGALNESREKISVSTKARMVNMTRPMLINDDLGAFGDFTAGAGRAAARVENAMFFSLLLANSGAGPTMADTVAMFHASHGNLAGTASVIDKDNVGKARAAFRKQVNIDKQPMGLTPKVLLVGPDKETEAEVFLAPVVANATTTVNPFSNKFQLVVDAAITGNAWYLFGDPSLDETNFIYGYLRDNDVPAVRQDAPFNYDGVAFRVIHDFGVGAADSRYAYRNAGA